MRLSLFLKSTLLVTLLAGFLTSLYAQDIYDNHALLFDGGNQSHLEVNADHLNSEVFSCFAWIKPMSSTPNGNLFGRWLGGRCFAVRINRDYTLRALVYPNITFKEPIENTLLKHFNSSTYLRLNEWNLVGVIVDGSTAQLVLNEEHVTVDYTHAMQTFEGNVLRIGGGLNMAPKGLIGYVDEVSYWKKAVSASDIKKIIACSLTGKEEGLALYYDFEQQDINSTRRITDLAGDNTGVIQDTVEQKKLDQPKLPKKKEAVSYDYERFPGAKYLNSMVAEYVNVDLEKPGKDYQSEPYKTYDITLGRDNWMYFKLSSNAKEGAVLVTIDDGEISDPKLLVKQAVAVKDGMAFLEKGGHKIHLWTEGKPSDIKFIARAIPEIVYYKLASAPSIVAHYGRNTDEYQTEKSEQRNWAYLKKNNLLAPYTTMASITKDRLNPEEYMSEINEWRAMGRRWVIKGNIGLGDMSTGEEFYQLYKKFLSIPFIDGVVLDEFGYQSNKLPKYPFVKDGMAKIGRDPTLKGKKIYGFAGGTARGEYRLVLEGLDAADSYFFPEPYITEYNSEAAADRGLKGRLSSVVQGFEKLHPGTIDRLILALAPDNVTRMSWDTRPDIDFKVHLEKQLHLLATSEETKDLYGIGLWTAYSTDDETLRWWTTLMSHYFIEGNTERYSSDPYELTHIKNPGFEKGKDNWDFKPATPDSLRIFDKKDFGFRTKAWYPIVPEGRKLLYSKRSMEKPNLVSQKIVGLTPGRLYSVRCYAVDKENYKTTTELNISVKVSGAEMIAEKSSRHDYMAQGFVDLNKKDVRVGWNYRKLVFRAQSTEAVLTLSDWETEQSPGGTEGQEICWDFIEIAPYFE